MSPESAPKFAVESLSTEALEDINHRIDFILEQHEPLRDKWESLIEGLTPPNQLNRLEDLARKRREALPPRPYISEKLLITKEVPEKARLLFEKNFQEVIAGTQEVDRGYNGRIMEYPDAEDDKKVVYKILIRHPIGEQNDLLSEASYLADLYALSQKNKDLRIGVPQPFYCATLTNARLIAMQKVPGVSVENVLKQKLPLPKEYDLALLEESLLAFVGRINAAGFHHNDLRVGNVMLNLEREDSEPLAHIVDTGNAKWIPSSKLKGEIDNTTDSVMIKKVVETLRLYRERQQTTEEQK
ncbi:MAG: hypothetical protein KGH79_01805 [Patescibacteria group bacterium]|nr:hypothetical protein [Patescibacteria group bacterium]